MSLDIARLIAFSGLSAAELQISVASSNISNADTPGYTQKTANQDKPRHRRNRHRRHHHRHHQQCRQAAAEIADRRRPRTSAPPNAVNSYLTELQQLFGTDRSSEQLDDSGTSLANTLASLESALSSLAGTPSSVSLQSAVVSALDDVASQLRADVERHPDAPRQCRPGHLRHRSTASTGPAADRRSQQARSSRRPPAGQSTADLEDQRNTALQDLSSYMNVSYFTTSGGDLQVFTASGPAAGRQHGAHAELHAGNERHRRRARTTERFSPITRERRRHHVADHLGQDRRACSRCAIRPCRPRNPSSTSSPSNSSRASTPSPTRARRCRRRRA